MKKKQHHLLKSEPDTYSIDDLKRDKKTAWTGVRNYQARNNIQAMQAGDLCLFYHTGEEKAVVGVAKVVGKPYPDPSDPAWTVVDVAFVKKLKRPVSLAEVKANPALRDMVLVRAARLSVQPVSQKHFEYLLELASSR